MFEVAFTQRTFIYLRMLDRASDNAVLLPRGKAGLRFAKHNQCPTTPTFRRVRKPSWSAAMASNKKRILYGPQILWPFVFLWLILPAYAEDRTACD
jgi:hypothetical protein